MFCVEFISIDLSVKIPTEIFVETSWAISSSFLKWSSLVNIRVASAWLPWKCVRDITGNKDENFFKTYRISHPILQNSNKHLNCVWCLTSMLSSACNLAMKCLITMEVKCLFLMKIFRKSFHNSNGKIRFSVKSSILEKNDVIYFVWGNECPVFLSAYKNE